MIGIIVDNVINNPENYVMFRELNKLSEKYDCYLFVNSINGMPIKPRFAILQQIEAMAHKGTLISTSILNTQVVANCLTAKDKFFYVTKPEWKNLNNFGASQLDKMFYNDDVKLIAGSNSYYSLINKLFKRPSGVVIGWDAKQLEKVVNDDELYE